MARQRRASWLCSLGLVAFLHAGPARAATPDLRALRNQIEDQVLDGDRDIEDLFAWQLAPPGARPQRIAPVYIGIEAFTVHRQEKGIELGAMLVLQLPLEGFLQAPAFIALPAEHRGGTSFAAGEVPLGDIPPTEAVRGGLGPRGLLQHATARTERVAPPALVVTNDIARACIRAALRTVGLIDDSRLDSIAARARSSAALPELRLRAARTSDQSGRVTLSDTDLYRYIEAGGATNVLEARLTFRLDRLLFADEEIAVERIRVDRSELRARTAAKVLQALFEWQRAYALRDDPGLSSDEHFSAAVRELETSAMLDVMTDGWFGRFRASLEGRSP